MFIFIFPKKFEFDLFIKSFEGEIVYNNIFKVDGLRYFIIFNDNGFSMFMCYVVEESDIMFLVNLNEFLIDFIRSLDSDRIRIDSNDITFVLFGTCGSMMKHEKQNIKLNDMFIVNNAKKIDRGEIQDVNMKRNELTGKDDYYYTFKRRNDKFNEITVKTHTYLFERKSIISTNHLYTTIKHETDYNKCLFDMETFDFFSLLKHHNMRNYYALRIISDILNNEYYISDDFFIEEKTDELRLLIKNSQLEDVKSIIRKGHLKISKRNEENLKKLISEECNRTNKPSNLRIDITITRNKNKKEFLILNKSDLSELNKINICGYSSIFNYIDEEELDEDDIKRAKKRVKISK